MRTIHELTDDELLEVRGRYFIELQEGGELGFITEESDIPKEAILERYEGTFFVEEDFWCNLKN